MELTQYATWLNDVFGLFDTFFLGLHHELAVSYADILTPIANALGAAGHYGIMFGVLIVLIVCVLAALTSDAIAAMITIQSTDIATKLLATGANPANLAALLRITSAGFDTLPWSTNAIIPLQVFGFNYKTGYKYVFAMTVALPMIMAIIGLVMSMGMA